MFIHSQFHGPALGVVPRRGHTFSIKTSRGLGGFGLALTLKRKRVRLLARDPVLPRQNLGRLSHDEPRQRTPEAVAVHRVHECEVAHLVAPARILGIHEVRHATHRLDTAGEHDL